MMKKHLGQNFLYDRRILSAIVEASGITSEDTVVEIGPGPGTLTRLLAEKAKKVTAIELDHELCLKLINELRGFGNIDLVEGDAMKYPYEDIGGFRVVANIPYYITTPIIFRLLDAKHHLESMTLTIQKEVAERIVAPPGGKDYGVLSIAIQCYAIPSLRFIVPKEAFHPVPKVDSAVVHISMRKEPLVSAEEENLFFKVVRTAFSQRRKTLSNSLKPFGPAVREALDKAGIDPGRRPETLSIEEFKELAKGLSVHP
ncbi:MAG: 16S rRNA (adenine(1518)-N(6)/adenine(1519)-N(6))-dimethyltransferase RsmA [Nitrospiraceae bacterium]|nr:16S rRNA (adenine(1518)-N(6)/adenine(1519)-N(6))-dimethyltransferase RsmA [Nitrospiraceae bacterium]